MAKLGTSELAERLAEAEDENAEAMRKLLSIAAIVNPGGSSPKRAVEEARAEPEGEETMAALGRRRCEEGAWGEGDCASVPVWMRLWVLALSRSHHAKPSAS